MYFDKTVYKIYLTESPFDEKAVVNICQEIDKANSDDNYKSILLIINSGGGNDACIMLYDYIQLSIKPVSTLACGWCASASMQVLQALAKKDTRRLILYS